MNYIVTGQPRCGTSMMMRCLEKAGIRMAFEDVKKDLDLQKKFRNIHGFYEGEWDGGEGAVKFADLSKFDNPYVIVMTRDFDKMLQSWEDIYQRTPPQAKHQRKKEMMVKSRESNLQRAKNYTHIIVDYDTFVTNPETYREQFKQWGLDFDKMITGIDNNLYINR
jgi:hypothetical protein